MSDNGQAVLMSSEAGSAVDSLCLGRLFSGQPLARIGLVLAASAAATLIVLRLDLVSQATLTGLCLLVCLWSRRDPRNLPRRILTLSLCAFVTLRYIWWRLTQTVGFHDPFSFTVSVALLLAEIYSAGVHLLGLFVNVHPLRRRPVPLPADTALWPTVDVLVPTYNEDASLLGNTLLAAKALRYPPEKLRVYLLDDGGTDQKCADEDPHKAGAAQQRRKDLIRLCNRVGARYLTRERNIQAKAGNINAALPKTDGEIVLVLDADHVPAADLLENTVGSFLRDPKLFLVQTPHFFLNPDPIERNLEFAGDMPSEAQMFYGGVQFGLDSWGASFFCGSAALLRRKHLQLVGGICGESVTEDAETALELHSRGYHSAYIGRPMTAGLQPETQAAFIAQRVRWAQGMAQLLLLKNPLRRTGLSWPQRLCYLSSISYWFFGFARTVFLLAPATYLIFGLAIYNANAQQVLAYAVPHLLATILASDLLFGHVRWTFISEIYEVLLSLFAMRGVFQVMVNPRAPSFLVTPKGEVLDEEFVSSVSGVFYVVYLLSNVAFALGIMRWYVYPAARAFTLMALAWQLMNIVILNACLGALHEKRQRRAAPRVELEHKVLARIEGGTVAAPCLVKDISADGAQLTIDVRDAGAPGLPKLATGDAITLVLLGGAGTGGTPGQKIEARERRVRAQVRSSRPQGAHQLAIGIQFDKRSTADAAAAVAATYGDSARWAAMLRQRQRRMSPLRVFLMVSVRGAVYSAGHARIVALAAWRHLLNASQEWLHPARSPVSELSDRPPDRTKPLRRSAGLAASVLLACGVAGLSPRAGAHVRPAAQRLPAHAARLGAQNAPSLQTSLTEPLSRFTSASGPLRLEGESSATSLGIPIAWRERLTRAVLHLAVTNSISLTSRSQFVVRLNGDTLAQMPLSAQDPEIRADVLLPPALLTPGYDSLQFLAAQHYGSHCEDTSAPELWSEIDTTRSTVTLTGQLRSLTGVTLADLDRLFDPTQWLPRRIVVVTTGGRTTDAQLRWGALLAQAAALRLKYVPLTLTGHSARPAAVAGPGALGGLDLKPLGGTDFFLVGTRTQLAPYLSTDEAGQITGAFLALVPIGQAARHFALIVSGRTNREVTLAAQALSELTFPFPDASSVRIDSLRSAPLLPYSGPDVAQSGHVYRFDQLHFVDGQVGGGQSLPPTLSFTVPADLYAPQGAKVKLELHFAYGAGLRRDSALDILLNGRFQQAIALTAPTGAALEHYQVDIPLRSLRPGPNSLSFVPSFRPLVSGECVIASPDTRLILFPDSTLQVPRAIHYRLEPSLRVLGLTAFPYAVAPNGSRMSVYVTSRDRDTVAAAWTLVAKLAQIAGTSLAEASYTFTPPATGADWLVVGDAGTLPQALLKRMPLDPAGRTPYPLALSHALGIHHSRLGRLGSDVIGWLSDPLSQRRNRDPIATNWVTQSGAPGSLAVIEQMRSPSSGVATVVFAADPATLKRSVDRLVDPSLWGQLRGSLAVWHAGAQALAWQRVGPSFAVGEASTRLRMEFYFSQHPLTLAIVAALVFIVLSAAAARLLWARRRRRRGAA